MADEDWQAARWFVCWIDLLGQKDAFMRADFIPEEGNPEKEAAFYAALRDSLGVIRRFRSSIKDFRQRLDAPVPMDATHPLFGLPQEQLAWSQWLQQRKVRHFAASDGFILACPLVRGEGHITPILGIQDVFLTLMTMLPLHLATKRPLRGGMDLGVGIEIENELFGAGLVKAYTLESTRAKYPRVVVGEDLMQYIAATAATPVADKERQYAQLVGQSCLGFIAKDHDGEWIFDHAGESAREFYKTLPPLTTPHPIFEARKFAISERERFAAANNQLLAERYAHLVNYFNQRAPFWGIPV